MNSPARQWKQIGSEIKAVRETYGPTTALGRRRTTFDKAPDEEIAEAVSQAMVEREPVTIVVSQKGWIRALRGHQQDLSGLAFKGDDALDHSFFTETTAKVLVFASNGRFYTIEVSKLPGGRGHGEPIRLYAEMDQTAEVVDVFAYAGKRKLLVASRGGNGFIVKEDDVLGTTRKGKQVLNVKPPDKAAAISIVEGDTVATIGENRKMVLFPLSELPEMGRGRGVRLQRYKDGGLSDVKVFSLDDGLTWADGAGRTFTLDKKEIGDWRGKRADAGRLAPRGFPKSNRFR
jgi:topoisomerase IV subunit A